MKPTGKKRPAAAAAKRRDRAKASKAKPSNSESRAQELSCDVLVVGMGFSGLVTALRALERRAKVIAIDKQPRGWWTPGGNMIISGGKIHLSDCSLAAPESELKEAITAFTDNMIPPDLLEVAVKNAGRALQWLKKNGAEFEEPPGQEKKLHPALPTTVWGRIKPGGSHDAANFGNKRLALRLESLIRKKGGTILYETKCIKLLTNAKGEVTGVTAQGGSERFNIQAKGVVLCSGGYERNNEMLLKYVGPRADEILRYGGPGCTGDGFRLCAELGAYLRSMNHVGFSHYYPADAYWKEDLLGAYLEGAGEQGIIVDRDGERFFDESLGQRLLGSFMTKTTIFKKGWIIIDHLLCSTLPKVKVNVENVREFGGTVHTANTIGELAAKAGIGPRLPLTVGEFNQAVAKGKTPELRVPRAENANRIFTPPFYAIPFVPGIVATYGGFLVNPKAQVLDWDKQPIPGLYAAGLSMEGSLSGGVENPEGAYCGCLSAGLIFGMLAAESIVTLAPVSR